MPNSAEKPAIGASIGFIHHGAGHTTMDALRSIQDSIQSVTEEEYITWTQTRTRVQKKTWSSLIGHIQSAIQHQFHISGAQPVEGQGIPLIVLFSWLIQKNKRGCNVERIKELLDELAESEHRRFRMEILVQRANELNEQLEDEGPDSKSFKERRIDVMVLNDCLLLCAQVVEAKKDALRDLWANTQGPTRSSRSAAQPASPQGSFV